MMRHLASLGLLALLATPAAAGDSATFSPFGYSDDRRYFAYEEFSIGDEATLPFASIGLIDLATGQPVAGSPWVVPGDEAVETTITDLRLEALALGGLSLGGAGIADPAHFLALVGDGVRTGGGSLTFSLPQGADPDALGPDLTLNVLLQPMVADDRCTADQGGGAMGFAIMLAGDGESREVHRQDAAAGADTCLRRIRLYGVLQPYNGGGLETLVAVVSLYTVGFEGYDRRFMVIPLGPRQPAP